MIRTELRVLWLVASASALGAACESNTRVGSECRHGVCPQANAVSSRACLVSSTVAEIAVTLLADESVELPLWGSICLPRQLPVDSQGHVACHVLWRIGEGPVPCDGEVPCYGEGDGGNPVLAAQNWAGKCSDLPFLESASGGEPANVCEVQQITPDEPNEDGWFSDSATDGECTGDGPRVRFTENARPPSGVVVQVACSNVQAVDQGGNLVEVDASDCAAPPAGVASDVGAACLPAATPEGGFADQEAFVETNSQACETGACLVYRLRGDPRSECEPGDGVECASQGEVEKRAYCSCRCDAPEGDGGPFCACTDGFTCVEVLPDGPPGVRGSYCVKNGTFSQR